jgi:hypothetical protein
MNYFRPASMTQNCLLCVRAVRRMILRKANHQANAGVMGITCAKAANGTEPILSNMVRITLMLLTMLNTGSVAY